MTTRSFLSGSALVVRVLFCIVAAALGGCNDDGALHLLQAGAPSQTTKDVPASAVSKDVGDSPPSAPSPAPGADTERLRKLMAVRILPEQQFGTGACGHGATSIPCVEGQVCSLDGDCVAAGAADEVAAEALNSTLFDECGTQVFAHGTSPECGFNNCSPCYYRQYLCVVNKLLDISGLRSSPLIVHDGDGLPLYTVPVQSATTNAALASEARRYALPFLKMLQDIIAVTASSSTPNAACVSNLPALAAELTDVIQTYEQATKIAVENILASSDAQLSSTPSAAEAAARQVAGQDLSRASAAHLLVGGSVGLKGSIDHALCDDPKLTPQARRALSVFRLAAISPVDLFNSDLSIRDLVDGGAVPPCGEGNLTDCCDYALGTCTGSGLPQWGSVRVRLAERYDAGLITDIASIGEDGLVGGLGLRLEDFAAARSYLQEEFTAFDRSQTAVLPALNLPGGATTKFARFAAIATVPQRPAAFWSAIASYDDDGLASLTDPAQYTNWAFSQSPDSDTQPAPPGAIHTLTATYSRIQDVKGLVEASTALPSVTKDATLTVLTPLAIEGQQRSAGVVQVYRSIDHGVYVYMPPDFATADRRIVIGTDGLDCALTNSIDGAECALESPLTLTAFTPTTCTDPNCYFINRSASAVFAQPLFLVEKDGEHYRPLAAGFAPYTAEGGSLYLPIMPEMFERVATILRPSSEWCARPQTSCAGEPFDARIALEDELSSDGDDIESSWRHYLTLARQAADEADLLGQQVLDLSDEELLRTETVKLNQIQRAEGSVEELQEICGIDVDPSDLIRNYSTGGTQDLSELRGPDCETISDCTFGTCIAGHCMQLCTGAGLCSDGELCISGVCTRDPLEYIKDRAASGGIDNASVARLNACTGGSGSVVDYATLGDQVLCFWTDSRGTICSNATAAQPCPVIASASESCSGVSLPPSMTLQPPISGDRVMNVFSTPDAPAPPQWDCDALRLARSYIHYGLVVNGQDAAQNVAGMAATNWFHPERLKDLATRTGWEGAYGGYAAITLDGEPIYRTGTTDAGSVAGTTPWPCAATAPGLGLLSTPASCATMAGRAPMNRRMLEAVVAAKRLFNAPLDNLSLPSYYYVGSAINGPPADANCKVRGIDLPTYEHFQTHETRCAARGITFQQYDADISSDPNGDQGDELVNRWRLHVDRSLLPTGVPLSKSALEVGSQCSEAWRARYQELIDSHMAVPASPCSAMGIDYAFGDVASANPSDRAAWQEGSTVFDVAATTVADSPLSSWRFGIDATRDDTKFYAATRDSNEWWLRGLSSAWSIDSQRGYFARVLLGLNVGLDFQGRPEGAPQPIYQSFWNQPAIVDPARAELTRFPLLQDFALTRENAFDALELMCEFSQGEDECPSSPPVITSVNEISKVERYMKCVADRIQGKWAKAILAHVPTEVLLQARMQGGDIGVFPALGGTYGQRANDLLASIRDIATYIPSVSNALRQEAADVGELKIALEQTQLRKQLATTQTEIGRLEQEVTKKVARLSRESAQAGELAGLFDGAIDLFGSVATLDVAGTAKAGAGLGLTAAQGESSIEAQTAIEAGADATLRLLGEAGDLQQRLEDLNLDSAVSTFNASANEHWRVMRESAGKVAAAITALHSATAALSTEQGRARRALYRAMVMDADAMKVQYAATQFLHARLNTARVRYEEAHRNARRMAFLARRAIEQRLGEDLSTMEENLPLVDAPARWVDSICATTGADLSGRVDQLGENFADAFIGDYVTRLENVVESYRITKNFHEGADTAVVSLRDDVMRARTECPAPVDNALLHSGALDVQVWQTSGCTPPGGAPPGGVSCVGVAALPDGQGPFPKDWPNYGKTAGYHIVFGQDNAGVGTSCPSPNCYVAADTRLAQTIDLHPGRYRLSWYARGIKRSDNVMSLDPMSAVTLRPGGTQPATSGVGVASTSDITCTVDNQCAVALGSGSTCRGGLCMGPATTWQRYFRIFDVPADDANAEIAIHPLIAGASAQIDIAALMLEDISDQGRYPVDSENPTDLPHPKAYMNTGDSHDALLPVCEDTTGEGFRDAHWTKNCVRLCPDGLRSNCAEASAQKQCYRETTFSLSQRDIESGRILTQSGFARGNFNYRLASLGLNFVGSQTRDCSDSPTPSTCYSAGFVPYTLEHLGPYIVRNYDGNDQEVQLFTGRIEHARGLAAERYLTNPLSSADNELITPYFRGELSGRPLDGTYVLRVWEEPGVNFDGIEDVQLVLNYRYWTRFR